MIVVALLALLAWVYLLLFRGMFWRVRLDAPPPLRAAPPVVAVIPARDEAETVGLTVRGLLRQDYPGPLSLVLVDDGSSDGTAARAQEAAAGAVGRLEVIRAAPTPPGWAGKVWAMEEGRRHALAVMPEARYLLLTDADIAHHPLCVRGLVARAEAEALDLASLMVRLACESWPERLLIPAFTFFFAMLYPFAWVADRKRSTAAAAGGCMLVRRDALDRLGGFGPIKGALIDDCALAAALKPTGPVWLGHADLTRSTRRYASAEAIWRMIARTAYTQLRHSPALLAATVAGMLLVYAAPPLLTLLGHGPVALLGLLAWLVMSAALLPTLRHVGLSPLWAPTLPLAALFYTAATIDSARRHRAGRGGEWKGRSYGAPSLTP